MRLDPWTYSAHQSLENFRNSQYNPDNRQKLPFLSPRAGSAQALSLDGPTDSGLDQQPMSDEALEQARQDSYRQMLANHRRSALQDVLRLSIVLLVSALLFFSHWRLVRRDGASAA